MERVILHCDMNNYFATVEEKYNPDLRKVPFVVCGDPAMRHNIVMAKNSLAKNLGIRTGISFYQAQEICPSLRYVKANMPLYLEETRVARKIFLKYTDAIIPYGMDESWLDLSDTGVSIKQGRQIADLIRLEIRYSQGLLASVGVSDNLIFAKLGSDYKKPNATTTITRDNYKEIVWPLPTIDLLFVGEKRSKILERNRIYTIGDIARANQNSLKKLLGKAGYDIWDFANGNDQNFHPSNDEIGSIGNTITPPKDLITDEDASAIIYLIVNSICARLRKHKLKAHCVSISVKDNKFNTLTRQSSIHYHTDSVNLIFNQAYMLFKQYYRWENPLRSIGIRVDNLIKKEYEQLSLFDVKECEIDVDIDERVKKLTLRLGKMNVEKTATLKE